jgi:hypothetical protein
MPATPLKYRIFRDARLLAAGTLRDEGHNVEVCREVKRAHGLGTGDVVVLDCAGRALCYEINGPLGAQAIARPEYVTVQA